MADWYRNDEARRARGYGDEESGRYGRAGTRERGYGEDHPGRSDRFGRGHGDNERADQEWYGRSTNRDRDMWDRGTDEVRSWFGDDEAEQRRRRDNPGRENSEMRGGSDYRGSGEMSRYGTGSGHQGQRSQWRDIDSDRESGEMHSRGGTPYASARESGPVTWTYTEIWAVPGPYFGQGPRGYQRSDDRIKEDVCERLAQHGQIDASNIEVTVEQGDVTLRGTVTERQMKRKAEDIAENVSGVRDVKNELRHSRQDQGQQEGQPQPSQTERTGHKERARTT